MTASENEGIKTLQGTKAIKFLDRIGGTVLTDAQALAAWNKLPKADQDFTMELYNMLQKAGATEESFKNTKVIRKLPKDMIAAMAGSFMETAKSLIMKEQLATLALFVHHPNITPVVLDMGNPDLSHAFVKGYIMCNKPDAAVIISDTYVTKIDLKKNPDAAKNYKRGDVEKSPERFEAIMVTVGSLWGITSLVQPYHREGDKIVFEPEIAEMKEPSLEIQSAFFDDAWDILRALIKAAGTAAMHRKGSETVH